MRQAWATLTDPVVTASDFLQLPLPLERMPKLRRSRAQRLLLLIAERRSSGEQRGDFLDVLLKAQKEYGFGEDLIVETIVSLTTAGISTVATALEWLLLLLAEDREAQERARRDSEFLDACILEALRLKTPLFIPRRCLEDIKVAGFDIPSETLLLPDSYKLAHDPEFWEEPEKFLPERFLKEERPLLQMQPGLKLKSCPFSRPKEAAKFLPFGLGARFCPGAPLAMEQLRIFASVLLEELQWRGSTRQPLDLSEAYSFTLTPANPAKLIFALAPKKPKDVPVASCFFPPSWLSVKF